MKLEFRVTDVSDGSRYTLEHDRSCVKCGAPIHDGDEIKIRMVDHETDHPSLKVYCKSCGDGLDKTTS